MIMSKMIVFDLQSLKILLVHFKCKIILVLLIVPTLPLLQLLLWIIFWFIFDICILYSYRFYSFFKAIAIIFLSLFAIAFESWREQYRKGAMNQNWSNKLKIDKFYHHNFRRAITMYMGAIVKSPILLSLSK